MPEQPGNLVLQLLGELRADIARNADRMATRDDAARLDILRADVASDITTGLASDPAGVEKRLGDQIAHLRRAVG